MSNDPYTKAVTDFHTAFGAAMNAPLSNHDLIKWRFKFLDEEIAELKEAAADMQANPSAANKAMFLRELADVLYVTIGFAVSFGLPLEEAFNRVHQANMSKLVDGKPLKNEEGKVLKGPNFRPPQLDDLAEQLVA